MYHKVLQIRLEAAITQLTELLYVVSVDRLPSLCMSDPLIHLSPPLPLFDMTPTDVAGVPLQSV